MLLYLFALLILSEICKRVLATSGDVITFQTEYGGIRQFQIPEGHVWLQGDNTKNSNDSRMYGPVPMGLLYGKAFCRLSLTNAPYFELLSKSPPSKALIKHESNTDPHQAVLDMISLAEEAEDRPRPTRKLSRDVEKSDVSTSSVKQDDGEEN